MPSIVKIIPSSINQSKIELAFDEIMDEIALNSAWNTTNITNLYYQFSDIDNTPNSPIYNSTRLFSTTYNGWTPLLVPQHDKIYLFDDNSPYSIAVGSFDSANRVYSDTSNISMVSTGENASGEYVDPVTQGTYILAKNNTPAEEDLPCTSIKVWPLDGNGDLTTAVVSSLSNSYDHFVGAGSYFYGLNIVDKNVYRIDLNSSGAVTGEVQVATPPLLSEGFIPWLAGNSKRLYWFFAGTPNDIRTASCEVVSIDGTLNAWEMHISRPSKNRIWNPANRGFHKYFNPIFASETYMGTFQTYYQGDEPLESDWDDNNYEGSFATLDSNGKINSWQTVSNSLSIPSESIRFKPCAADKMYFYHNSLTPKLPSYIANVDLENSIANSGKVLYKDVGSNDFMNWCVAVESNRDVNFISGVLGGSLVDYSSPLLASDWKSISSSVDILMIVSYTDDHISITYKQGSTIKEPFFIAPIDIYRAADGISPNNPAESWGYPRWAVKRDLSLLSAGVSGVALYTPSSGIYNEWALTSGAPYSNNLSSSAIYNLPPDFGGVISFKDVYPVTRYIVHRDNIFAWYGEAPTNYYSMYQRGLFGVNNEILFTRDSYASIGDQVVIDGNTYRVIHTNSGAQYGDYHMLSKE